MEFKHIAFFFLLALALFIGLYPATDEKTTIRVLQEQGYEDIQITGYKYFACGKGDFYHTGFKAKNPKGNVVEGCACEGMWFKGTTLRFD